MDGRNFLLNIDPLTYFDLINPKRIFLENEIFWLDLSDQVCLCRNHQEKGFVFCLVKLFFQKCLVFYAMKIWISSSQSARTNSFIWTSNQEKVMYCKRNYFFSNFNHPSSTHLCKRIRKLKEGNAKGKELRREIMKIISTLRIRVQKNWIRLNEVNGSKIFYHPGSTHPKNLS